MIAKGRKVLKEGQKISGTCHWSGQTHAGCVTAKQMAAILAAERVGRLDASVRQNLMAAREEEVARLG